LVDELHILDIPDESARSNALLSGQIDLLTNVSYTLAPSLASGGMKIFKITGNILNVIVLAPDVAPFTWKDKRVREAFALSIDRQQIISVVYRGDAVIGNDQPIGPSFAYHPTGIPVRKRDIARAKKLLAAAGHPRGLSATMFTADASPGMLDLATVVARQVKDAGFNITLKKWPADSFWNDVWLHKDFYTSAWTGRPTPELFLGNTTYSTSRWNESHFRDKTVDRLLTQAKQTTNASLRTKLYSDAMRRVADSAQWIVPAYGKLEHAAVQKFSWDAPQPASAAPYLHNARLA
jgi:peptide/nickel transport system substrate-binding protein